MSSRRTRISEEEINELISKLQSLLPESRRRGSGRVSNHIFFFGFASFFSICKTNIVLTCKCSPADVGIEVTEGDVQLHQEPAPGGGRPERPAVGPHVHHGQRQRAGRDRPEPPPVQLDPTGGVMGVRCRRSWAFYHSVVYKLIRYIYIYM